MTEGTENTGESAPVHAFVTGRLCACNGMCHRETLQPDVKCTLDEQLDSLKCFVIVCIDRTRESDWLVFWRPNSRGYTTDLEKAGSYSSNEAKQICASGYHVPFLRSELERSTAKRTVIDRDASTFFEAVRNAGSTSR